MRVYEYEVELKSPTIVVSKRTRAGFVALSEELPGSTVRGAILTALHEAGREALAKSEAFDPSLVASPAYPIKDGNKALPGHFLTYKCKLSKIDECFSTLGSIEKLASLDDVRESITSKCLLHNEHKRPATAKRALSTPLTIIGGKLVATRQKVYRAEAVGISKRTRSAEHGMLFTYEVIAEGSRYWGTIADVKEKIDLPSELDVTFGRGGSRGFGSARLRLREANSEVEKLTSELESWLETKDIVFAYAISPSATLVGARAPISTIPIPPVDLRSPWLKQCKVSTDSSLQLLCSEGRLHAFGARRSITGWSLLKNMPKPRLAAARPGSLFAFKLKVSSSRAAAAARALAAIRFVGADSLACAGLNFLWFMTHDPFEVAYHEE